MSFNEMELPGTPGLVPVDGANNFFSDFGDALLPPQYTFMSDEGLSEFGFPSNTYNTEPFSNNGTLFNPHDIAAMGNSIGPMGMAPINSSSLPPPPMALNRESSLGLVNSNPMRFNSSNENNSHLNNSNSNNLNLNNKSLSNNENSNNVNGLNDPEGLGSRKRTRYFDQPQQSQQSLTQSSLSIPSLHSNSGHFNDYNNSINTNGALINNNNHNDNNGPPISNTLSNSKFNNNNITMGNNQNNNKSNSSPSLLGVELGSKNNINFMNPNSSPSLSSKSTLNSNANPNLNLANNNFALSIQSPSPASSGLSPNSFPSYPNQNLNNNNYNSNNNNPIQNVSSQARPRGGRKSIPNINNTPSPHSVSNNLLSLSNFPTVKNPSQSIPILPADNFDDFSNNPEIEYDRENLKKIKHQQTDRQRRAKIKEGMEALRALVSENISDPNNPNSNASNSKPDQATIVLKSVEMVRDLKDEVTNLKNKLRELQLKEQEENNNNNFHPNQMNIPRLNSRGSSENDRKNTNENQYQESSPAVTSYQLSPLTGLMSSLNAAGVSMWRIGLTGRILEVNLVFEMITGFQNSFLSGRLPSELPLKGSFNFIPSSIAKYFLNYHGSSNTIHGISSPNSDITLPSDEPMHHNINYPPLNRSLVPNNSLVNLSEVASVALSKTQTKLLLSDEAISQEINIYFQSQFINSTINSTQAPLFTTSLSELHLPVNVNLSEEIFSPLSHVNFLINYFAILPPNYSIKLFKTHQTNNGDILQAVTTLSMVRNNKGEPEYFLALTTPDSRRLIQKVNSKNNPNPQALHLNTDPSITSLNSNNIKFSLSAQTTSSYADNPHDPLSLPHL